MGKQHILRSRKRQGGYKKVADGCLFYPLTAACRQAKAALFLCFLAKDSHLSAQQRMAAAWV